MTFQIRLSTPADTKSILDIYAPYILNTTTSFEYEVPSLDSFQKRIDKYSIDSPWLVCCFEDQVVGFAYACEHRSRKAYQYNRELSVYVNERFHGKKIGKALYHTLIEISKLQGYQNFLAGITQPNEPSVKFHKGFGFNLVGTYHNVGFKFGKYVDVSWWELNLDNQEPGEIIPYLELASKDMDRCISEGLALIKQ